MDAYNFTRRILRDGVDELYAACEPFIRYFAVRNMLEAHKQ